MNSTDGRAGRPLSKETEMTGTVLWRCHTCGQLAYDPRTGECIEETAR